MNETRKSSLYANNDKRSTYILVEETGAQMLMSGLEMDNFDGLPYSLMFMNNVLKN